jgi:hypothetical protein
MKKRKKNTRFPRRLNGGWLEHLSIVWPNKALPSGRQQRYNVVRKKADEVNMRFS